MANCRITGTLTLENLMVGILGIALGSATWQPYYHSLFQHR
jgi:hypothetical protein